MFTSSTSAEFLELDKFCIELESSILDASELKGLTDLEVDVRALSENKFQIYFSNTGDLLTCKNGVLVISRRVNGEQKLIDVRMDAEHLTSDSTKVSALYILNLIGLVTQLKHESPECN